MIIYISGPITGHLPSECEMKFNKAKNDIIKRGHFPVSPWDIGKLLPKTFKHSDYMEIDMDILAKCDAILMLEGWERSKGCKEEQRMRVILDPASVFYHIEEIPEAEHVLED